MDEIAEQNQRSRST